MQGDIPVMRPPRKPTRARVNMLTIRRRINDGLVWPATEMAG
jgi:hypothetical protein